jgi:hypothetical protein
VEETVTLWNRPAAGGGGSVSRGNDRIDEPLLSGQAEQMMLWATPRSSPNENRQTKPTPSQIAGKHGNCLAVQSLTGPQAQPTEANGSESLQSGPTSRRRLNARFVEWLQGLSAGWVQLEPMNSEVLEIWRFRCRQLLVSLFS